MLEAMLVAAGHRVATFTSPHLIDYRERIRVGGEDVSATSLIVASNVSRTRLGPDTLTFFEFNTLTALLVFETAMPDAIVLEVGMGGRLDAVNVVDADAAIVASIALDHTEWLGNDLESIAREKAGIFRPGRAAIYGGRHRSAALEADALAIGARLKRRDIEFRVLKDGSDHWKFEDPHWSLAACRAPRSRRNADRQCGVRARRAQRDRTAARGRRAPP
jgi:dihydrofolate synthase/folylpolyglutamate synthase